MADKDTELLEVKVTSDAPLTIEQIEAELRETSAAFQSLTQDRDFHSQRKLLVLNGSNNANGANGSKVQGNAFARLAGPDRRSQKVFKVTLDWRHVTYSVPVGKRKAKTSKVILNDLTGTASPGQFVAVMGPTGCGKTSLLSTMAGRLPRGGSITGEVLINGKSRTNAFRKVSAYVLQDDVLFGGLTVRETLQTAANLRLSAAMSRAEKQAAVEDVIAELGLLKCADTYVGSPSLRGVSGGERKRTNIGVEMMGSPSLIFLDEPTSGLDSFQAMNVMESLWNLAHNGRTVISTIHQPRSSIYNMFDLLLLLSEGCTIYFGPANQAVYYFWRFGFTCPEQYNPADYFLDVVSMDFRNPEAEKASRRRNTLFAAAYALTAPAAQAAPAEDSNGGDHELEAKAEFATSWITQFAVLLVRSYKQAARDRLPMLIGLANQLILGVILGVVFGEVKKDQKGINDTNGILFFICLFSLMSNLFVVLNTFPAEKNIINRERSAKSFRLSTYYASKMAVEVPVRVFFSCAFSAIVYWMVGLNGKASHFFIFIVIVLFNSLGAQGLGIMVSSAAPNEKVALALTPALAIILIMFSGFYINVKSIPVWLQWIEYVSVVYYTFIGLTINNYRGTCCWSCDTSCTAYNERGECTASIVLQEGCLSHGEQILDRLSFAGWDLWKAIVLQIVVVVVYNLLGFIALRRSKPKYQPLSKKKDN